MLKFIVKTLLKSDSLHCNLALKTEKKCERIVLIWIKRGINFREKNRKGTEYNCILVEYQRGWQGKEMLFTLQ